MLCLAIDDCRLGMSECKRGDGSPAIRFTYVTHNFMYWWYISFIQCTNMFGERSDGGIDSGARLVHVLHVVGCMCNRWYMSR